MVLFAVNLDGTEVCSNYNMYRAFGRWSSLPEEKTDSNPIESWDNPDDCIVELPKGTIEKLIGRKITWDNAPYPYEVE